MGSEWHTRTLGDVIELKRGYDLPKQHRLTGNIPIISSSGVSDTHIEAKVKGPGVITGRYGTIGQVFYSDADFWPLNTTLYVKDFKGNDPKFVYYFLQTINYAEYSDKAAVPGVNRNHLHMASIFFPRDIPTQRKIAHILGMLDNKIELNRQINTTLEAMAQALFKSWFVDFDPVIDNALAAGNEIPAELAARAERRAQAAHPTTSEQTHTLPAAIRQHFPDRFVFTDTMGWVPEGWGVEPIGNLVDRFSVGKKFSQKTASESGSVPILDQGKSGVIGFHSGEPGIHASPDDPIIVFANHTCYMRLVMHNFSAIQNVLPFRGKALDIYWLYFATLGKQPFIEYKGHWPDFVIHNVVIPNNGLDRVFGGKVAPMAKSIFARELQSESLANIRDTLLPKLLSGQLSIPDAQAAVDDTLAAI